MKAKAKTISAAETAETIPLLRDCFAHLFKFWDALKRVEDKVGFDVESQSLMSSVLAVSEIEEISDKDLEEFLEFLKDQ